MERMSCGLHELKFAEKGEAMTLEGYGAVFGNVDAYGDVIVPGAFAKSLAAHRAEGTMPQMLLEHGTSPLPIGVWKSIHEDGHGLKVEGEFLTTSLAIDAWKAAKAGAINGLSIGYRPTEFEMRSKPTDPRRTLKAVDLVEISIVGRPANTKARIGQVKSTDEIMTIRDLEDALRDAGWSKSQAVAVCARFQAKADQGEPDATEALTAAAERLLKSIRS